MEAEQILVCLTVDGRIYAVSNISYKTDQLTYVESYHEDGRPYVHKTIPFAYMRSIFWLDDGIFEGIKRFVKGE